MNVATVDSTANVTTANVSTADVTTANVTSADSTANVSTADVTTANVSTADVSTANVTLILTHTITHTLTYLGIGSFLSPLRMSVPPINFNFNFDQFSFFDIIVYFYAVITNMHKLNSF